jgi:ribosomal protein S9
MQPLGLLGRMFLFRLPVTLQGGGTFGQFLAVDAKGV